MNVSERRQKRHRRHKRIRAKIKGTAKIPRFCVFRSSKHIYAQLINDEKGNILVSASDLELKKKTSPKTVSRPQGRKIKNRKEEKPLTAKSGIAFEVGRLIAEKALNKKIARVTFDRAGYQYHGRVKALAEGAREGGLNF